MGNRSFYLGVIVVPLALWAALMAVQFLAADRAVGTWGGLAQLVLIVIGGWVLWRWNALPLTRHEEAATHQRRQLEALRAATLALTTEMELQDVLQKVVDLSRDLVSARYAAVGVLDETGAQIEQFITSGMSAEQRTRIGAYPQGRGLLGILISGRASLRINDMAKDPRAVGFPPHHPPMTSFLGVPILARGQVFGNLYLTDKLRSGGEDDGPPEPFSAEDQEIVEMFARQAAIAIENALLLRRSRQLAVAQERERFAMDLHDGLIQSVYAVGLTLDGGRRRLEADPGMARQQIDHAIDALNGVISDIRNYILNLRAKRFEDQGLEEGLHSLMRELRANSFLRVEPNIEPDTAKLLTADQATELLYIAQEALANVRKHALATGVTVRLTRVENAVQLSIADDGRGLGEAKRPMGEQDDSEGSGNGLRNIRNRARKLNGDAQITAAPGKGTNVTVRVPIIVSDFREDLG